MKPKDPVYDAIKLRALQKEIAEKARVRWYDTLSRRLGYTGRSIRATIAALIGDTQ